MRIVESILGSRDWRAQAWYLERTDSEQFARVAERPIPVDLAQPAEPLTCEIIVRSISDEEKRAAEELMQHRAPPPAKEQDNTLGNNGGGTFIFERS